MTFKAFSFTSLRFGSSHSGSHSQSAKPKLPPLGRQEETLKGAGRTIGFCCVMLSFSVATS